MSEFTVLGLRVVREAARHGSFSTAAERLDYTQSAVSRQIALMEQAAGRSLFERHARGVQPTDAGRVVLRHAETVLAALDNAHHDLQDMGTRLHGRLRVGAISTAMGALVPRAIAATLEQQPFTRIPLREGLTPRLLTAIDRGRLDLAVAARTDQIPPGVEVVPLLDDPLLVAFPPDHVLAGHTVVTVEALQEERWIAGSTDPGTTLLGAWSGGGGPPEVAFVARDWVAKLGLVSAGLGVTVVPGLAVPALPSGIALARIDHPAAVRPTVLASRSGLATDHVGRTFAEALRDAAAALAAEVRERLR